MSLRAIGRVLTTAREVTTATLHARLVHANLTGPTLLIVSAIDTAPLGTVLSIGAIRMDATRRDTGINKGRVRYADISGASNIGSRAAGWTGFGRRIDASYDKAG